MKRYLSFNAVVRKNEFKAIAGRRYRTIAYLTGMLSVTFLCIGFSYQALEYQRKLADNPFSNWINIEVTRSVQDSSLNLLSDLRDPALKNRFLVKNIYLSKGFGASFLDRNGVSSALPLPKARTIDPRSPIIADLLEPDNFSSSGPPGNVFQRDPFGMVVTDNFLKKTGFHRDSVKYLSYGLYSDNYIPVRLLGVARELPDHADVLCTDMFYIMKSYCYPGDKSYSKLFIETTEKKEAELFISILQKEFQVAPDSVVHDVQEGITVLFFSNEKIGTRQIFRDRLGNLYHLDGLRKYHFGQYTQLVKDTSGAMRDHWLEMKRNFNFDYLAVEFNRLDKLKEFSDYIKKRYRVSINLETVEQRENFLFSLNMSFGAIILVLMIAGLSVLIFLSNSLRNHLDKVKRNLGNFMAFGANRNIIIGIYTIVVLKILLISMIIASALAWITGEWFGKYILKRVLILGEGQDFFSLFNLWFLIFSVAIIVAAVCKTLVTVRMLVFKSPGDLIYEREKQKLTR
ncbi:MAG: hypothetical protein NT040_02030 [Bacteroidetes bacterium]|nr:hypothetical protein [Bacteroidota bacterium]